MKLGIITDIHSNKQALKAVLEKFDEINIDKIICCGDIIGIGPNPEEVTQMLMERKDILIAVRGNHEKYLIDGLPKEIHDDKRKMSLEEIRNHEWNHSRLSEESKKFIEEMPIEKNIEIEKKKIYIIHYPNDKDGTYKKHIKNPTIIESQDMFEEIDADIFLYGHTHMVSVNNNDNKWYVNPGSLGCPMDSCIANAGVLSICNEKIDFQCLNIKYDVEKTKEEINNIKFPMYEKILKIFYGNE